MKRQFVAHGQLFAKIKRMKCKYYTLEYYPTRIKRKSKYLTEEMIDYPPPRGCSCRMI
ncbi:MAG: hypothetical protein IJT36_02460 [Alphaproteobacteria bacterium]|nr:hypothetical protein [Alphaproteobacteria bacterium]